MEGGFFVPCMHHCHCGYCRKSHGSACATMIGIDPKGLHWQAEGERIAYRASESLDRISCGRCGSPLPAGSEGMPSFVPTGLLEGDFGHRAESHIFVGSVDSDRGIVIVPLGGLSDAPAIEPRERIWVGSKAAWHSIEDDLPRHTQGPPG